MRRAGLGNGWTDGLGQSGERWIGSPDCLLVNADHLSKTFQLMDGSYIRQQQYRHAIADLKG
jgi:hypothetical protein